MSEITHPRGLTYRTDEGSLSIYDFWLRGRPVLKVAVDNADPELKILVGKPDADADTVAPSELIPTKGRAVRVEVDEDGPQLLSSHSIRNYVQPRLAVLIARVYVPGDLYAPAAE